MLIRRMIPEDAAAVATIQTTAWQETYRGIVNQAYLDSLDIEKRTQGWSNGILKNEPPIIRLVAEEAGTVLGFACGLDNRSSGITPSCDSELWAIYVLPGQGGRGIGAALFDGFKKELNSAGKKKLCVWALVENKVARSFYQKQGGVLIRESKKFTIGEQALEEVGYEFEV